MRYCLSCKYLSPSDAVYCGHCARSFNGRRCPQHHLSPPDSKICIQCGATELTEPTGSFSPQRLLGVVGIVVVAVIGAVTVPRLIASGAQGAKQATSHLFSVWMLDKFLAYVVLPAILLHLIPGEIGRVIRRNISRALDRLLRHTIDLFSGFFYFLGSLMHSSRRR